MVLSAGVGPGLRGLGAVPRGLEAVDRAALASPTGHVVVDDPGLQMHSSEELKAELQRGMTHELSDLNPMNVLRTRK